MTWSSRRIGANNLVHECEEVDRGVCVAHPMRDLTGRHLERREEVHDAMALVVMRVSDARPERSGNGSCVRSRA